MRYKINSERLWASLMAMAEVGATHNGGCNRQALTMADKQGRDLFVDWCEQAGCKVHVDTMGNIFARREGKTPNAAAVATGSHLDTQPSGGRFDGILGVLAGLEVVRTLNDFEVQTERPIEVVNWTNEEGSRFAPPTMASAVYAQEMSLAHAYSSIDAEGVRFSDALVNIGYQGDRPCQPQAWYNFFELHIEQGPILEAAGNTIGIVTAAQGLRWFDCQVVGQAAHAGTTPMTLRKDALATAANLIAAIRTLALNFAPHAVATVGRFEVLPGSPNVVPGAVNFSIDLRHPEADTLATLSQEIKNLFKDTHAACHAAIRETFASKPVQFNANCIALAERATKTLGYPYQTMISGATHDALKVAAVTPAAMIFVPSSGGISHNEMEWTSELDCAAGTNVLLHTLLNAAHEN